MPPLLSFMETMKSQWGEKLEETFKSKNTLGQQCCLWQVFIASVHKNLHSTMFNYLNHMKEISIT